MIINTQVYGMRESFIASGYPKKSEIVEMDPNADYYPEALKRAKKLAACKPSTGHDCFLKGIIVQADFIMSHGWWMQAMRYNRFDIVSSQSKEHNCEALYGHNDPDEVKIGDKLGARVTTNFLQLKTMYGQRRTHRRQEWAEFCKWVESIDVCELITR